MKELYNNLGFFMHPFTSFSAEEEVEYLDEIAYLNDFFNPPKYFNSLYTELKNGASRFIFGERGSGKTALMLRLKRTLEKEGVFTVLIDDYDAVNLKNNSKQILIKILQNCVTILSVRLLKSPGFIKKLSNIEKEKLSFFITVFFKSLSRKEFEEICNKVAGVKTKNIIKLVYNRIICRTVNQIISSSIEIVSSLIKKTLSLDFNPSIVIYKEYLPEIKIEQIADSKVDASEISYEKLKDLLKDLTIIIKKLGFKCTTIFFDRIDEFRLLEGKVDKIVNFVQEILQDTSLLLMSNIAFAFIIWNRLRIELNAEGVRFDKFKPRDISWDREDIEKILDKRLFFFSIGKVKTRDLIKKPKDHKNILNMSNNSPRDLLRLMSYIYDEQANEDIGVKFLYSKNVSKGIKKFVKEYDYYSMYPKKGTKEDIYNVINEILKIRLVEFTVKDIIRLRKISHTTAMSHIRIMKNYNLIEESNETPDKIKYFKIKDPKILFLINNNVQKLTK